MATVGELLILIAGNNAPLTASLAASEAQLKGFQATAGTSGAGAAGALVGVGVAAAAMAVATGAAIVGSANAAADFQEQMATINTIAHQTPPVLEATGQAIRNLSVASGTALPDLTAAFYDLLSVGVPAANAMEFLTNSVTLSIGGISTTNEAVLAITNAINAWSGSTGAANLAMSDSAKVMDIFAKSIEIGGLTAADIAPALANVAALAANMNTPLEEVAATMALLTTRSFSASEATTSMNAAFVALQRVPPGMQELQDKTGKAYEQIARTEGIHAAIVELVADAAKYNVNLVDVFGRVEALGYVLNTTGSNAKAYGDALAGVFDATGTGGEQMAERMGTFTRQTEILGAAIQDVAIEIGTGFLPGITAFVQQVSGAVEGVADWARENPGLASTILLVTGAVSAFVAVAVVASLAIGAISAPIAIIVAAVGGLGIAFATNFGGIRDVIGAVTAVIGPLISQIAAFVTSSGLLQAVGTAIGTVFGIVRGVFEGVVAVISTIVGWIATFISHLTGANSQGNAARTVFDALAGALTIVGNVLSFVINVISTVVAAIALAMERTGAFRLILAALGVAGQVVNALFGLLGDALRILFTLFGQVAGVVGGAITTAFNAVKGVIDGVIGVINGVINGLKSILDFAGKAVAAVTGIPGAAQQFIQQPVPGAGQQGQILGYATGGVVPGRTGAPQLAVVHGGETITPPGSGAGTTTLVNHTHLSIDGNEIREIVETVLFNSASTSSSGFTGSPVTS